MCAPFAPFSLSPPLLLSQLTCIEFLLWAGGFTHVVLLILWWHSHFTDDVRKSEDTSWGHAASESTNQI